MEPSLKTDLATLVEKATGNEVTEEMLNGMELLLGLMEDYKFRHELNELTIRWL
jgi:hypothetical protein